MKPRRGHVWYDVLMDETILLLNRNRSEKGWQCYVTGPDCPRAFYYYSFDVVEGWYFATDEDMTRLA